VLADNRSLTRAAAHGHKEVTAVSFHAYAHTWRVATALLPARRQHGLQLRPYSRGQEHFAAWHEWPHASTRRRGWRCRGFADAPRSSHAAYVRTPGSSTRRHGRSRDARKPVIVARRCGLRFTRAISRTEATGCPSSRSRGVCFARTAADVRCPLFGNVIPAESSVGMIACVEDAHDASRTPCLIGFGVGSDDALHSAAASAARTRTTFVGLYVNQLITLDYGPARRAGLNVFSARPTRRLSPHRVAVDSSEAPRWNG